MTMFNHGKEFSLLMFYQVWSVERDIPDGSDLVDVPDGSNLVEETRTVTVTITTNISVVGV